MASAITALLNRAKSLEGQITQLSQREYINDDDAYDDNFFNRFVNKNTYLNTETLLRNAPLADGGFDFDIPKYSVIEDIGAGAGEAISDKKLNITHPATWTEKQLWTVFALLDGIHDYGDIDPTRSNSQAYEWYLNQPIPEVLYSTVRNATNYLNQKLTIADYIQNHLFAHLKQKNKLSGTENNFITLLKNSIPSRIGIPSINTKPSQESLDKYNITESDIFFEINMKDINDPENFKDKNDEFLTICASLRLLRLNKSEFKEEEPEKETNLTDIAKIKKAKVVSTSLKKKNITNINISQFESFFKRMVDWGQPWAKEDYITNYDASPGFYKYLFGFKQVYTPLNFLDSAESSKNMSADPENNPAKYIVTDGREYGDSIANRELDWHYKSKLMLTKNNPNTDTTISKISDITIITSDGPSKINSKSSTDYPLRIIINPMGADDLISRTYLDPSYGSGPTLGYISNLISNLQAGMDLNTSINLAMSDKKNSIYNFERILIIIDSKLRDFLSNGSGAGAGTKRKQGDDEEITKKVNEFLCRFICDWKGFGDAEQVRFVAEKILEIQKDHRYNVLKQPSIEAKKLMIMGTVDENSWTSMRLRGISSGWMHGKYYDFVFFPPKKPTKASLIYSRFTSLLSSVDSTVAIGKRFTKDYIDNLVTLANNISACVDDFKSRLDENQKQKTILNSIGIKNPDKLISDPLIQSTINLVSKLIFLRLANINEIITQINKAHQHLKFFNNVVLANLSHQSAIEFLKAGDDEIELAKIKLSLKAIRENCKDKDGDSQDVTNYKKILHVIVSQSTQAAGIEDERDEITIEEGAKYIEKFINNQGFIDYTKRITSLLNNDPVIKITPKSGKIDINTGIFQTVVYGNNVIKDNEYVNFKPSYLKDVVIGVTNIASSANDKNIGNKIKVVTDALSKFLSTFIPDSIDPINQTEYSRDKYLEELSDFIQNKELLFNCKIVEAVSAAKGLDLDRAAFFTKIKTFATQSILQSIQILTSYDFNPLIKGKNDIFCKKFLLDTDLIQAGGTRGNNDNANHISKKFSLFMNTCNLFNDGILLIATDNQHFDFDFMENKVIADDDKPQTINKIVSPELLTSGKKTLKDISSLATQTSTPSEGLNDPNPLAPYGI